MEKQQPAHSAQNDGTSTFTSHSPLPAMHNILLDSYWPAVALSGAVQLVVFLRWLYRRIRNDELTRAFVHDMATNHLPHIYERLEKLCEEQGIDRKPLPPIRWLDLSNRSRD